MFFIAHKGYDCNNSFISIYKSLSLPFYFKQDVCWGETDLLWTGTQWILCHDFNEKDKKENYETAHFLFKNLQYLSKNWKLILDIKWDAIFNYHHDFVYALNHLSYILPKYYGNICVQFSYASHVQSAINHPVLSLYKIGYLMEDFSSDKYHFFSNIHFLMINIHKISQEEILMIKKNYPDLWLIGFTCFSKSNLKYYKHLFTILNGLVCEL